MRPTDHVQRVEQARRRAQWELGDSTWADIMLDAYWDHEEDAEALKDEMGADDEAD